MKLYYFPIYGLGEPIRMALWKAGIQYENVMVSEADWPALKESGKFDFG